MAKRACLESSELRKRRASSNLALSASLISVPVAQLDRALVSDTKGRPFESGRGHHTPHPRSSANRVSGYEPEGREFESLRGCQFRFFARVAQLDRAAES